MKESKSGATPSRRKLLLGMGAATALGIPGVGAIGKTSKAPGWDATTDVLVVGSGCAAGTAAVTARSLGAQVIVIEKMPVSGGTTAKSGGGAWIPNNAFMEGSDNRDDCLRYMARFAYPQLYDAGSKTLGLPPDLFALLEAFYDNGAKMIQSLEKLGVVRFRQFRMFGADFVPPDYCDHLPESNGIKGRTLDMVVDGTYSVGGAGFTGGRSMINQMEQWLKQHDVAVLYEHRALSVIKEDGRVVGAVVEHAGKQLRIRARKGVIFGTGGYAHNPELIQLHQPGLFGSCATPAATGDFIPIAQEAGARMGDMTTAWRSQVILEQALKSRVMPECVFFVPGDSMIQVNKYGRRVVNEKRNYNDRTRVHFVFDPVNAEYPNRFLFMVFDERTLNRYAAALPLPVDKRESKWLIEGNSIESLAANIRNRLDSLGGKIGSYRLAPDFASNLDAAIQRFNGFAETGRDEDFDRGLHEYDRAYMSLFSPVNKNTSYPNNDKPNATMYPIDRASTLYAVILAPGALDTSGGPSTDANGQVLSAKGSPIPGLYGAGNCVASATGPAYLGAGGTIGPAMTFGYLAARHAVGKST